MCVCKFLFYSSMVYQLKLFFLVVPNSVIGPGCKFYPCYHFRLETQTRSSGPSGTPPGGVSQKYCNKDIIRNGTLECCVVDTEPVSLGISLRFTLTKAGISSRGIHRFRNLPLSEFPGTAGELSAEFVD